MDEYHNMIAMFYPGFNKFIPDRNPLTEILSIQARHTLNNNVIICFISSYEFYFTLFKMKHFLKKYKQYLSIPGVYNFLKMQITQSLAHLNVTGCQLWFTGCSRSLQRFVNGIQESIVKRICYETPIVSGAHSAAKQYNWKLMSTTRTKPWLIN